MLALVAVSAQNRGQKTADFLNLPFSSRIAALGGNFAPIHDHDLSLAIANPSLVTEKMDNTLAMTWINHFAGINSGSAAYAHYFGENIGTFTGSINYLSYGSFSGYDYVNGAPVPTSDFSANDLVFNIGWGRYLDSVYKIGANLKILNSNYESYHSWGVAVDVAASYVPNDLSCLSIMFKNIGRQISSFTGDERESYPFEIQAGYSHRLAHAPFRYMVILTNLQKWDLTYDDGFESTNTTISGEEIKKSNFSDFADKAFRHVVIGAEFLPAKFLSARIAYNWGKRQEMKISGNPGMVGFSWGIGLKISKFSIDYSRGAYHINGSPNYLTISTNFGSWKK